MRLDFNALWIEDQPDHVKAQAGRISRGMEEYGFNFNVTICATQEEMRSRISTDVFTDEVDLILVDWDLGGGREGQDAIAEIRERVPYKEVIFYSARTPPEELRKRVFDNSLEGIYCTSRENLVDEVIGVFDSLVKKVLDLDHSRGIVMGATCDIDDIVNKCLTAIHDKLDANGQEQMLQEGLELIKNRLQGLVTQVQELEGAASIHVLMKEHFIFTANDRLRILTRLLDLETMKDHKDARASVVEYMGQVVPGRNILGHVLLVPEGKPTSVMDASGRAISLEETRELRRQILGLRSDFRDLLAALRSPA